MMAVFLLAMTGSTLALVWLVVHQITVASLHRAVASGRIDPTPGDEVRPVTLGNLGVNPDAHYRYLPFRVPEGKVAVLEGRTHPRRSYLSVTVYDRLLQSVDGDTFAVDPPVDAGGRFRLVLTNKVGLPREAPRLVCLDVSKHPEGVLLERHFGPEPVGATRLRLVDPCELEGPWP